MNNTFLQGRIAAIQTIIIGYETAIESLIANPLETYKLDTGQNITTVTRVDVDKLTARLNSLYNTCATMEARLNGSGVMIAQPGF